jgi:hypothetical protein
MPYYADGKSHNEIDSYIIFGYYTCSLGQVDPMGVSENANKVHSRDGNCSVNLASQGHCTGVFIGTRATNVPRQGRLCPRVPGLSLEYSHKGGYKPSLQKSYYRLGS